MASVNPLSALTAAALALPAFSATQPAQSVIAVTASRYDEKDAPADRVIAGATDRYGIDIGQFYLLRPIGRNWSLTLDATREAMSGASPWGTVLDPAGAPELIMSGATIVDTRTEVGIGVTRYFDNASYSVTLNRSTEDDYKGTGISLGGEWSLRDDLTTLSGSIDYSSDKLSPSDAALFGRVPTADKNRRGVSVGITQILGRGSLIQTSVGFSQQRGFLSDPYKLRDLRPAVRNQRFATVRYRHYVEVINGAAHLDYRYYHDSYGVRSSTFSLAWHQNLTDSVRLAPSVRYYTQSSADFFLLGDDFSLPQTAPQSSDHRLSGFDAIAYGLSSTATFGEVQVTAAVESYNSAGKGGVLEAHPGAVDFTLVSIGIEWQF